MERPESKTETRQQLKTLTHFRPESIKVVLPLTRIDPTKPLDSQTVKFLDLGNAIRNRVVSIETEKKVAKTNGKSPSVLVSRATYPNDARIVLVKKKNPHRPKTLAFKSFELYRKAPTVGDFVKRGGDRGYLQLHSILGHVRVRLRTGSGTGRGKAA